MNEQPDDEQLLSAFAVRRDESALAELMRRHGDLVRAAVLNVTGNASMADDITQATFLALVRKARTLRAQNGTLAGWLYRVATCLARNARRDEFRRRAREKETSMLELAAETDTNTTLGEAALAALCEELGDLAEKYRQPVILHHLKGMSYEAAAPLCGCSPTTFGMRLTRGREQLRGRLMKRGVTLGATALIAGLGQSAASAAELPAALVASTCQAATAVAAGGSVAGGGLVSAKVAALTDSALKLLFWGQVKTVAVVCAAVALVGAGGVGVTISVIHSRPHESVGINAHAAQTMASPEEVWIKEILRRAEAGAWDMLDFGKCGTRDREALWLVNGGSGAGRRFWSTPTQSADILFDTSQWTRGMLTARFMILSEGETRPELALPRDAQRVKWASWTTVGDLLPDGEGPPQGVLLAFRYDNRTGERNMASSHFAYLPKQPAVSASTRGVWYRYAVYLDRSDKEKPIALYAFWPEDSVAVPAPASWSLGPVEQNMTSCGFMAHRVPMLLQEVKFVPLGPDVLLPPASLLQPKTHSP